MFEHSVRVPRHFKIAANIVQKVTEEGGSVKTLLYDNKLKHFRTSVLYALINESIKHAADIENMFENTGILVNEPRLDPWLAKVLTAELIYGKKSLPGKSKPEQTILSYKERFAKFTPDVQDDQKSKVVRRPRYVRINTNLLTTSDAIRAFQDEGYKFIRCTSGSYNDYLQQVQNLTEYDFTQDYHVKTIFVFPPGTKLHEHDLYLENKIILQDKATALAVHLLAAPPGSVVLDMCAAPGMKTTQLAAYLRNQGKIYAVERNEKRYETLCQYVEATASKCVETLHKDSLEIRRGDLDDVEYILLDPSCSGSGMELSVHNYIDETRLAKLTSLQEKFLKHAMNSFPNAKRIVYSTCSIFPEENERVVTNIVKASRAKWRVKDVKELLKDQWNNFGSGMYGSMGTRCLYAKPDTDFTIGFFLAVLDKDLRESEKLDEIIVVDSNNKTNQDSKTNRSLNEDANDVKSEQNETRNKSVEENEQQTKKKKKKKHDELQSIKSKEHPDNSELSEECNTASMLQSKTAKKKRNSEIIEKSEEKHKISDSDNKKLKINVDAGKKIEKFESKERSKCIASQKSPDDITSDSTKKKDKSLEILEASENISIEYSENQMSNKKKKKRRDSKSLEAETETVKENYKITSENDMLIENEAMTKKMKKKRKDLQNESLEVVTETIIDIPSNIEQEKTSKKGKKRKNQKDSLLSPETENERLNNSFDVQTLNSEQLLEDTHDDYKAEKAKKRKHKLHKEEIEDTITDSIVIDDNSFKTEKETKKKKKKRELVNSNLSCELMQESDTMETKHRDEMKEMETDVKQHFITEVNQSSEVPKKKKKKRESETS